MIVKEFLKQFNEQSFFKKFIELGGSFSQESVMTRCSCGKYTTIDLKDAIEQYVNTGLIKVSCECGQEFKFNLKDLLATTKKATTKCPYCGVKLPDLNLKLKDLTIPYRLIHYLFEHSEKIKDNKKVKTLINYLSK